MFLSSGGWYLFYPELASRERSPGYNNCSSFSHEESKALPLSQNQGVAEPKVNRICLTPKPEQSPPTVPPHPPSPLPTPHFGATSLLTSPSQRGNRRRSSHCAV